MSAGRFFLLLVLLLVLPSQGSAQQGLSPRTLQRGVAAIRLRAMLAPSAVRSTAAASPSGNALLIASRRATPQGAGRFHQLVPDLSVEWGSPLRFQVTVDRLGPSLRGIVALVLRF